MPKTLVFSGVHDRRESCDPGQSRIAYLSPYDEEQLSIVMPLPQYSWLRGFVLVCQWVDDSSRFPQTYIHLFVFVSPSIASITTVDSDESLTGWYLIGQLNIYRRKEKSILFYTNIYCQSSEFAFHTLSSMLKKNSSYQILILNYYIHIPFCRQKCPYCKFALTPIFDEFKKRRYIAHLKDEIESYFSEQNPHSPLSQGGIGTIYFGGGTPSVLALEEVENILSCFKQRYTHTEISFECNPEDITPDYVSWLIDLWVNRISLWVQSLNDMTLRAIHRSDKKNIIVALETIGREITGIPWSISINIDFILGLPYSKAWEILKNIQELHRVYPYITHTSIYMLEDGHYPKDWKAHSLKEGEIEREYSTICEYFKLLCWNHYEISNWSKPGYESRHNSWYWDHTNYRGFGLSATSYIGGKRWENSHSFQWYYKWELADEEILNSQEIYMEKIIFWMRTFSLANTWFNQKILRRLVEESLLEIINNKIHLTPSWIFQENTIISQLIE